MTQAAKSPNSTDMAPAAHRKAFDELVWEPSPEQHEPIPGEVLLL